ncbi:MAG: LuxR C-terminal-related transcriptional regulator [Spirochaetaceae bacterium]|jgi:LuxR family maltose regulon positive regulatory protein|nr:LuxR C-terminal-related transcriptional regulator [Spirochaetaceae bacterium]
MYPDTIPANLGDLRFLERPRVDHIIEQAIQSRVVTVVAGEGSGKTLAVHSFLQKKRKKIIWMQLSERDNLIWHFWENYVRGIARLNPEAAKTFINMGFPESERRFDSYLGLIQSGIISKEQYTIVLDDFHLLTNPIILKHIGGTLIAPVSKSPTVLISRTEPALNTVNLLAKGLLSQITVEDLRFTREETEAYFRLHNVPLEEEELSRIFQETEGWALALGLILQGIKAEEARGRSWDRVMQPVKKMEETIFSAMGKELQKFLVKLSLIEHWPRNLLERLEPGGKSIAEMEKFSSVIRFDVYLHGFRIHRLFLDFLKEKQACLSREEIREVYGEAARWCIENKLLTDAAVDYERAEDCGGLVRIIESLPRMLSRTVASFLLETTERLISTRTRDAPSREEDWDFLFLRFIVHGWLLALLERYEEAAGEFQAGIVCFETKAPGPGRSRLLAAAYNRVGILRLFRSRFTKDYNFACCFEQGCRYYLENPEPVKGPVSQINISSYVIQVGYPAAPGEIDVYLDALSASIPYTSISLDGYLAGADALSRAELAYYRGDFNKAEQFARQAAYQSREKKQYEVENQALFYLMRVNTHKGDIAGVQEIEQQMKALLDKEDYLDRHVIYDIIMGRFFTRLGLAGRVALWLRKEWEEGELNILFRGFDTFIKARCFCAEKKYAEALHILEQEHLRGELGGYLLGFLETNALEAVIRHHLGDRDGAFAALKKAYHAAKPHGLDMPFIELGELMYNLTNALLKAYPEDSPAFSPDGIPRAWLQSIRRSASASKKKCAPVTALYSGRSRPASADFSHHELEILSSLSQGHTSEEIAGDMNISVKMVRSAIRSLYSKLGASNKAGAIRIATERGLLAGKKVRR